MKLLSKILIPLAISALALWLATRNVAWEKIRPILSQAKAAPFLWGFLVSLIAFYLRAVRWQILLLPFQKISPWVLLRWQVGGILVNNLLPLRMGELARGYWAGHKSSVPKSTVIATIVLERSFDLAALIMITAVLFPLMGITKGNPHFTPRNIVLGFIMAAALLAGALFLFKKKSPETLLVKLKKLLPEKLGTIIGNFITGLHVLKDKKEVIKLLLLSPFIWAVDIFVIAIFSRSLDLNLSWLESGVTMGGLVLGMMVPAAPGAVGTYEAGGVHALALIGRDPTLAFSFIALLHVLQMAFIFLVGIPALMIEGFNPKKFYKEMSKDV